MKALSLDLRERVVAAIRDEKVSCRAAARQFKVSYASAIRWAQAMRECGSFAPLGMGGDTRSQRVEAHADYLLSLNRLEPDLTLAKICARLERARGEKVSPSMIWRFFDRHIESKACPGCGGALHCIGEEVSKKLDIVSAQFRCWSCTGPNTLAAPAKTWSSRRPRRRG